jgi:ABC-2 type transport system permease protein
MTPTTMLSGYTFAIDQMPAPIQAVTLLVYARYYVTILRDVFLKGSPLQDLLIPIGALSAYAAAIIWIAARSFRDRLD